MFFRSGNKIWAIDLLTLDTTIIVSNLTAVALDVDIVEKKLYFSNGSDILRANLDGTNIEVILAGVDPYRITVDWIGRRIFWIKFLMEKWEILDATLDGQDRRVLITTLSKFPLDIAVGPTEGLVLFICGSSISSFHIKLIKRSDS